MEALSIQSEGIKSKKRRKTQADTSDLPPKKRGRKKGQTGQSAPINLNELFCGQDLSEFPVNLAPVDIPENADELESALCEQLPEEQDNDYNEDIYYYLTLLRFRIIPGIRKTHEEDLFVL